MPTGPASSTLLFFAAEILISCLLAVIGLFWLLRRRNRQFQQSEQTLAKQSRALVETFLARELQATQVLAKTTHSDELLTTLIRLRSFWLAAEQLALIEHGTRLSDYKSIAATLKASRIYTQLKAQPKPPQKLAETTHFPPADSKPLDAVREVIRSHEESAQQSSAAVSEATRQLADTAVANSKDLLQTIIRLEHELRELNTQYQIARNELDILGDTRLSAPNVLVMSTTTPIAASTAQRSQSLLNEMRATFDHGALELQRLRETNSRQRDLILEMETRLSAMQPGSHNEEELTQLIEKLQLQLRDYDNCTAILEMESESLRDRIETFTEMLVGEHKAAAPELRAMSDEEAQLLMKRRQGLDKNTFQMLLTICSSTDLTQAAAVVMSFLQNQHLRAVLFVKGHQTQLWLASESAIDTRIKSLLQSVEPNPANPRVDDGEAMMVLLPLCRVYIAGDTLKGYEGEMQKDLFLRAMVLVDLMLTLFDKRAATNPVISTPQIDQLATLLADIETQQLYLDSETQRIVQRHRQELAITLGNMATTASQKMVVEGLLGDFTAELDMMGRAAKVMHKSLQLAQQSVGELKP